MCRLYWILPGACMNVKEIIEKEESETIEFKKSTAQVEKALKSICGFLNHKGGRVYFGIDNGKVVGQEVSDQTLKSISQKTRQKIKPEATPEVKVLEIKGKKVIEVKVKEGGNKPYYLNGIAHKRVGTENVVIPPEELERLIMEKKKGYWDKQTCEDATLEDIDWGFVKEDFITMYEKTSEKIIESKPVNLLRSFSGEKLDYKEFTGNLFQQIDACNNYLVEHTALMSKLVPGEVRRRDIPEYGMFSVRELITNAICHRDYADQGGKIIIKMFDNKIEFYSLGGLPEWITPENIISEQYSRNPTITKVLAKVEYIEELGEGWDKIIKEHNDHPLNPEMPEIKSTKNSTLVTLFSTKEKFEEEKYVLNERQGIIIDHIRKNGRITTGECAGLLEVSNDTSLRELSKLKSLLLLSAIGKYGATKYGWQKFINSISSNLCKSVLIRV
jgi:ATP-dependent DNA helicase RecG